LPAALSKQLKANPDYLASICEGGSCTYEQEEQYSISKIDEAARTVTIGAETIKLTNVASVKAKPKSKTQ